MTMMMVYGMRLGAEESGGLMRVSVGSKAILGVLRSSSFFRDWWTRNTD